MQSDNTLSKLLSAVFQRPMQAYATIRGGAADPNIKGNVCFYPLYNGTFLIVEIGGLPLAKNSCDEKVFGLHIHEGTQCTSDSEIPFELTGDHYNPDACMHPSHAGDLPPLFSNDGYALFMFYTSRFYPEEVIGKTLVIHDMPDDFQTQPSGNSGLKIACGEIMEYVRN